MFVFNSAIISSHVDTPTKWREYSEQCGDLDTALLFALSLFQVTENRLEYLI